MTTSDPYRELGDHAAPLAQHFEVKFFYVQEGSEEVHEQVFSTEHADEYSRQIFGTIPGRVTILTRCFCDNAALSKLTDPLFVEYDPHNDRYHELHNQWLETQPKWFRVVWIALPDDIAESYVIEDVKVGKNSQWLREVPPAEERALSHPSPGFFDRYFGEVPATKFAQSKPRRDMQWDRFSTEGQFSIRVRRIERTSP